MCGMWELQHAGIGIRGRGREMDEGGADFDAYGVSFNSYDDELGVGGSTGGGDEVTAQRPGADVARMAYAACINFVVVWVAVLVVLVVLT